jgi:methionine-gamma-lyase
LQAGDTILSHLSLYGGTQELMQKVLEDSGIKTTLVDMRDLNQVHEALLHDTTIRLVHLETPANPTIRCVDIEAICSMAHERNIPVSVDNTFATPYLQQPFLHGADFVVHLTNQSSSTDMAMQWEVFFLAKTLSS